MWRKRNPPHVTDRSGRNSIDDFPLVPERPKVIVEMVGLDHSDHPINRAKRAEAAAIQSGSPSRPPREESRGANEASRAVCVPDRLPGREASPTIITPVTTNPLAPATQPASPSQTEPCDESHPHDKDLQTTLAEQSAAQTAPSKHVKELLQKLSTRQLHELHCTVCDHPFRAMIDEEFLHWISPDTISRQYDVGWRCIYRHAHATGLFERRYRNLRFGLAHIAECANHVMPTSRDVIRAFHHLARISATGEWIEPPTRVVVSSGNPAGTAVSNEAEESGHREARRLRPGRIPGTRGGAAVSPRRPRRVPKPPKQPSRKTR